MAVPSPGYSLTLRVQTPISITAISELAAAVGRAGGSITALDVAESGHGSMVVDVSCNMIDAEHGQIVRDALSALRRCHGPEHLGPHLPDAPRRQGRGRPEGSLAQPPRSFTRHRRKPQRCSNLINKRNTIAVVTDGLTVLGLGNIGPAAALPVTEGKAALFKQM